MTFRAEPLSGQTYNLSNMIKDPQKLGFPISLVCGDVHCISKMSAL